ncbi:MAG: DUF1854 domain-containing protein [Pirellulales bacterium]
MSDSHASRSSLSADFALHRDACGRLVLVDGGGEPHVDVAPVRAFPLSDPGGGVAICDATGKELAWIERLDAAPSDLREALEAALADREFAPKITRIHGVQSATEPSQWDVETDRGRTQFVVKNDEDVRRLDGRRALVVDAHGIRYLIEDTRSLDAYSRRMLERFL